MNTPTDIYSSKEYKRSRNAYFLEATFEYCVALIVADAFLASLLSDLGFSDAMTGIITSLISLAFLFQLFSVFTVHKIRNTKRFSVIFHMVSEVFFLSIYLIPFFPFAEKYKQILLIVCMLLAYFGNYYVTSVIYKWGNSFIDPKKRGISSANKEMISLIVGMVVTLIIGYAVDFFEKTNNKNGGFIFSAAAILIFSICDFVCLMLIKNDVNPKEETRTQFSMRDIIKNTFGNKNFVNVIILTALWNIARYTTVGFLGTYRLKELLFSVGAVQVINIAGTLGRFFLSKPFGTYSDKRSYASGIKLALTIAAIAFGINIFTAPESRYLIVIYTLLYDISIGGINQNLFNITYSYVDSKYFVQASAIKNSIGGICGFAASALAGKLLSSIQANGNTLFGIEVYGQQVLSIISCVLIIVTVIFIRLVIEKQKIMLQ